ALTADGVSIFNVAHPLPSGGSCRNRLLTDADLSPTMLDEVLSDFETQFVGDSGIIYMPKPKYLLVHPDKKRYASEIVGSDLRADTANNNLNSIKGDGLVVVSSPHLTDPSATYLLADSSDTGARIIARQGLMTSNKEEFDTDTFKYKASYREDIGFTVGYGSFGTAGA